MSVLRHFYIQFATFLNTYFRSIYRQGESRWPGRHALPLETLKKTFLLLTSETVFSLSMPLPPYGETLYPPLSKLHV